MREGRRQRLLIVTQVERPAEVQGRCSKIVLFPFWLHQVMIDALSPIACCFSWLLKARALAGEARCQIFCWG